MIQTLPNINETAWQVKDMGYNNKDFIISENSTQLGLASFVTEFAENIKRFFIRTDQAQAEARHQLNRKRQMQKQVYQDTIGRMTVEQKLKMGICKF